MVARGWAEPVLAGVYENEHEAQSRADFLNEQVAEEREDDA